MTRTDITGSEVREALRRKIELRWSEYRAEILCSPAAELFSRAGEIAAAQLCHEQLSEYLDCYAIEGLEYLLRFEDPLAVVRDQWASRQECDPSHEFKQILAELQDEQKLERDFPPDADWTPEQSGPFLC